MRALYKHDCWFMVSESEHIWFNYTAYVVVGDAWFVVRLGISSHSAHIRRKEASNLVVILSLTKRVCYTPLKLDRGLAFVAACAVSYIVN